MASEVSGKRKTQPALAATYSGGDRALLIRLAPILDALEISPDTLARADGGRTELRADMLSEYTSQTGLAFTAHGIGLSLGSFDGWNEGYLPLLDHLLEHCELRWHSEHLGCTFVAGESLGTMLSLPRTQEVLDLLCPRIQALQRRYGIPFLVEHVAGLLPESPAEYSHAAFLNALTRETGCGLLLDAYNLECDAHNHALDIAAFLNEVELASVRELHLAGGVRYKDARLDVHSRLTEESTLALGLEIIARCPQLELVTFEFMREAVPVLGHDAICGELLRIREALVA